MALKQMYPYILGNDQSSLEKISMFLRGMDDQHYRHDRCRRKNRNPHSLFIFPFGLTKHHT